MYINLYLCSITYALNTLCVIPGGLADYWARCVNECLLELADKQDKLIALVDEIYRNCQKVRRMEKQVNRICCWVSDERKVSGA